MFASILNCFNKRYTANFCILLALLMPLLIQCGDSETDSVNRNSEPTLEKRSQELQCSGSELRYWCECNPLCTAEWCLEGEINSDAEFQQLCQSACNNQCASTADVEFDLPTPGVPTFEDRIEYLFSGTSPIQTDTKWWENDAERKERLSAIQGRAFAPNGDPLEDVQILVRNHQDYGWVHTRHNGRFEMAVDCGEKLIVDYEHPDYLPIQRTITAKCQQFNRLPGVVLIEEDQTSNPVDLSGTPGVKVARGTRITASEDADGERQATVLIPSDVHAEIDGTPLTSSEDIRLTEYTVGPAGRARMPGELPPLTGYTYAVELAVAGANADDVIEFKNSDGSDAEVAFYVENFIGFDIGEIVPAGYWDREQGSWVPSDNGCVIEITDSNSDGTAEVTANPDSSHQCHVSNLGIDGEEKDKLGTIYSTELSGGGTVSLWRTPMTHFTPWDCNFPWGPPSGAGGPDNNPPEAQPEVPDPCNQNGSIIECENQVLGEQIDLPKTGTSLNYRTSNAPGYAKTRSIDIQLIDEVSKLPDQLNPGVGSTTGWIEVDIEVAGQSHHFVYQPSDPGYGDNLTHTFSWDGKDHLGRTLRRSVDYKAEVSYVYPGVRYREPTEFERSFAQAGSGDYQVDYERTRQDGNSVLNSLVNSGELPAITARLSRTYRGKLEGPNVGATDLGGWRLNQHHTLDIDSKMLLKGDGTRRRLDLADPVIETVAGGGSVSVWDTTGSIDAMEVGFPALTDIYVGPDKRLHVVDSDKMSAYYLWVDGAATLQREHVADPYYSWNRQTKFRAVSPRTGDLFLYTSSGSLHSSDGTDTALIIGTGSTLTPVTPAEPSRGFPGSEGDSLNFSANIVDVTVQSRTA